MAEFTRRAAHGRTWFWGLLPKHKDLVVRARKPASNHSQTDLPIKIPSLKKPNLDSRVQMSGMTVWKTVRQHFVEVPTTPGFRFRARTDTPFTQFPHPTFHDGATGGPDPGKMDRSDPPRGVHSRLAGGEIYGLTLHRVLWYFAVQSKRAFKIPIPYSYGKESHGQS